MPQKNNNKEITKVNQKELNKKERKEVNQKEVNQKETKNDKKKTLKEDTDSDNDSDIVSEIDDAMTTDIVSKDATSKLEEAFKEKVIKWIKIDDLMRKETIEFRDKMNTLKEEKEEMQTFMIRYLDSMDENIIDVKGSGKLSKCESVRKGTINKDLIKQSICEQLKKEKIVKDDKAGLELAENTYNLMESKREIKKKVYLKRTFDRPKKDKKGKKNGSKK